MPKRSVLTSFLAVVGTALVWFPVLTPILFSALRLIQGRVFHFDFLMPAEFFPAALIGGGLLLWAALRARSRRALIGGSLGVAIVAPILGQVIASLTGLASGETEPVGAWWALVLAMFGVYILALVIMGVGGVLLLREVFHER